MKKKIVLIIGIIVIIGIFAKIFIFYDKYKIPKGVKITTEDKGIEVYDKTNLYDLIKNSNVDILTEDTELDYMKVGQHKYTIEYKYKLKKYLYDLQYIVEDNVNPIFINVPSKKTLYINEANEESLTKKVSYADNYDVKPKLEIDGEVKFNEIGKYKIKYIITDQSGNETIKDAVIEIKERPEEKPQEPTEEEEEPEEDFISIEEQIENYKTSDTMIGIDISKWQGEVDFEKVKNAGVEFVILRMGVMKNKDTPLAIDNTFEENYKNAKNAGLKIGVYIYSESNTIDKAIENAEFVIENLKGDKLDFPVCFDWECWAYFNDLEINLYRLNEMYDAFSDKLKDAGYDTMLYASENYLNNTWLDLKDYTIWAAKYSTKKPSISRDYILWQNSDKGRVDGIEGNVDLDVYYKIRRTF